MDLKALKTGDIFLKLKPSTINDFRRGFFHVTEYGLITPNGCLVIKAQQDRTEVDFEGGGGFYHNLTNYWEPVWYKNDEYALPVNETESSEIIALTTFELIKNNAPQGVYHMFYAALHGLAHENVQT